ASGLLRDIRSTHPYLKYEGQVKPIVKKHGDVYSRTQVRIEEVYESLALIRKLVDNLPAAQASHTAEPQLQANRFALSLVEGWRGEICHCAITDNSGKLALYKIKDPSFHNWDALELAVRNNEISDFPICNKSFNLSYCGHDL
ncbi:MAG: hydrogenase, partial [bacterium]|nr:hydrogenase [Candidatus Limimorpha equi]